MIIHTVLEEERIAFTNHVNQVLKKDPDVSSRLPISHKDIFDQVQDGVILCKLINTATLSKVPPISPAAINTTPKLVYQKIQNLNLAIQSAKAIGCTVVNIQPDLIMQKRQHIILGLIWQIIKIYISSKITLKQFPQIMILRKEDQPVDIMQKLGYEDILLRWLNYHIKKNGGNREIKNLGNDMIDGYAYGNVLQNVAPSLPKNYYDMEKEERAKSVIQTCEKEGLHPPIGPDGIVSGNPRLNTLLCAQIFNNKHGLIIEEEKQIPDLPPQPETDQTRQIRVFKNWINSQGIEQVYVNYLMDDLRDGIILLKVLDHFKPGIVNWKQVSTKKNRIFIIQNCNYVVEICNKLGTVLVGVGGIDIVDGSVTLTLALVWQLCKMYWEQRVGKINEQQLVVWANERVPAEHHIKSFKDKSISNCLLLLHVINSMKPNTVDFSKVPQGDSEQQQITKINYTISCARKLGCQIIALWQHVNECTSKYVALFVAELQHRSKTMK